MGFLSRRKIYVSSTIYNMAGNYSERTSYLKFLVLNGVLSKSDATVAETLVSGTLNGPRMNYRAYYRWAKNNYPEGMPIGGIYSDAKIQSDLVEPYISVPSGYTASADITTVNNADYWIWAEAYVYEHHPSLIDTEWNADIDNTNLITITFEDTTTVSFMPDNFDPLARYIYSRYSEVKEADDPEPRLVSTGLHYGPFGAPEDITVTSNHYLISEEEQTGQTQNRYNIVRTTKTYSDGRAPEITETKTVLGSRTYAGLKQVFERYNGIRPDAVNPDKAWWDISRISVWETPGTTTELVSESTTTSEIEPGVTETTVVREWNEVFLSSGSSWWYREDLWEKDNGTSSDAKLFIYKIGDGIAELDELGNNVKMVDGYFPMIPVRTDNVMVDAEPHLTEIFPQAEKAWKRATGGKRLTDLIDQVADNEDLEDIDYSFLIWGVSLNTLSREGKLYIYKFFDMMKNEQVQGSAEFDQYVEDAIAYSEHLDEQYNWLNPGAGPQSGPPEPAPEKPVINSPPLTTIHTQGQHPRTEHYNFKLNFNSITETIVAGKWKPDAKRNDVQLVKRPSIEAPDGYRQFWMNPPKKMMKTYSVFDIYWQENEDQHRILTVVGAYHENTVYKNKSVIITAEEALDDDEDSGFVVPLHMGTLRAMPIVWANQLALESILIIFNCYKIVKKKWYETFLGSLLIGLITMGIGAVFSGGASIMGGAGILGSNAAVGSMFGLSGVAGALAGAAINSIVMTTIMTVIQKVAVKLGPLGAIFSALAGIALGALAMANVTGQSFSLDVFLRADNLLKLTNATINAYSLHVQEQTQDIYGQMADLQSDYNKQKREIDQLMYELTGFASGFDPMILTEIHQNQGESRDAFNQRTLMTGSDIAELTHRLIDSFASTSIDLEAMKG